MSDKDLESELERLKKAKVVSEETAAVYLSQVRKLLKEDSSESQQEEN